MNGTTTLEKEWAAIDGEEIAFEADTRGRLETQIRERGLNPDDYEIVALPKAHYSVFV